MASNCVLQNSLHRTIVSLMAYRVIILALTLTLVSSRKQVTKKEIGITPSTAQRKSSVQAYYEIVSNVYHLAE